MKKSRLCAIAFAAFAMGAIAFPAAAQIEPNWAGLYVGGDLGVRRTSVDFTTQSVTVGGAAIPLSNPHMSYEDSGFRIGPFLGYNWRLAPQWVGGVEADFGYSNSEVTQPGFLPGLSPGFLFVGAGDTLKFETPWDLSLRGRFGYLATPSLLIYGTIGIAIQEVDGTGTCVVGAPPGGGCAAPIGPITQKTTDTPFGWTLGAGVEMFLMPKWTVRAEYRYSDYGTLSHTTTIAAFGGSVGRYQFDMFSHTFKVGVAYKFD